VTFTLPASGASAALSSGTATTGCDGLASVTAIANTVVGSYGVTATASGAGSATFNLTNAAGPGQTMAFVQQPTDTTAGSTIAPPVVVVLQDAHGNPVANSGIVMAVENAAAPLHGTLTVTTDSTGHATFRDLSITLPGTYNLQAAANGLTAISGPFTISAGSAVSIAVSAGDGQTADVGTAFAAPLEAIVQDAFGNPRPGASVTFTAPVGGASATFTGSTTVMTNENGIAISPAKTANSQTGSFQVTAITTGVPSAAIFTLTNVAATANRLAFVQQPTDTTAGAVISPAVTVQLQDSQGNAVHTAGIAITIQLVPAQTLAGTSTQATDANGLATFANLSVQHPGQFELLAEAGSIVSVTSHLFNITAGGPTALLASGGTPQSAIIHTVFGAPLQATITDAAGNPVSGVAVTFNAPISGASGLFGGQSTLTAITDGHGHASAVITANGIAGSYGVTASSASITGSATFSLTNLPLGSSSLAFVQQPTNTAAGQVINPPVTVRMQDASGQPVSAAGVPIVLSLSSGTGTLLGTLVQLTDGTGLATFKDVHIGETGTKRLRATASQEVPADSNPFQITAGPAASITAIGGTPQAAIVLQQFPSPLRAQVRDTPGNAVSGVTVTFSSPASGPSGTFAGPVTVTTDGNEIATGPTLTANSQAGSFMVTATATGTASPAAFALTNLPQQPSTIILDNIQLAFTSEINQAPPPGQIVQITAPVSWTVSSSASWLSAAPASGSISGPITVNVNPAGLAVGVYTGSIRITGADGSVALVFVTYTITDKPSLVITPHILLFSTSSNTIVPATQTLTATSTSRAITFKASTQVSTPSGGDWLKISTVQGQTPGSVIVTANPAGLADGVYDGSVLFTSVESGVNAVAVPVSLIVGCGQGGCVVEPNIIAVVNGASFQPGGAPRAIMTIFGTNLSDNTYQATSFPLPTQLGPTSVMANGLAVPLYFVSPTQINFQMLSDAPAGPVQVVVKNQTVTGRRALGTSQPHISTLMVVDPGLFVTNRRRAAALNVDLSVHTAATPIPAGGFVILFLTGEGPVTPAVADGTAAPASPLSLIDVPVTVTIGGKDAMVTYQGLTPGLAGLAQLNVIVPAGLTPGDQPVFVTINGKASNAGLITVK
jgi:adhesin/invasin